MSDTASAPHERCQPAGSAPLMAGPLVTPRSVSVLAVNARCQATGSRAPRYDPANLRTEGDVPDDVRLITAQRMVTMAGRDATAIAFRNGRVLDVGSARDLRELFASAKVTDLGDATVVPGLNDAHMHPGMASEDLLHADASPERARTRSELLTLLTEEADRTLPPWATLDRAM